MPYTRVPTDIREIVFDARQEENPCSLCSKMRRGALNTTMKEHGCNKLALGHHFDDAVETFMMSLVFEGRLNCFKPVTYMSRADVTQIRPLLYIGEQRSANLAGQLELPVVKSTCPMDHTSSGRRSGSAHDALGAVPGYTKQGVRRDAAPAARRLGPHAARARQNARKKKRNNPAGSII